MNAATKVGGTGGGGPQGYEPDPDPNKSIRWLLYFAALLLGFATGTWPT